LLLAISGTFTVAIPLRKRDQPDGCANIHQSFVSSRSSNTTLTIKYEDVKSCYMSFPFDLQRATEVVESLKGIFKTFYVFFDQSREPAERGFDFRSVDINGELDKLLKNDYATDFEFMTDVTQIFIDLKDGHTDFRSACYNAFFFLQDIWLYSTVDCHGSQIIKVLQDDLDSSNNRCEVTKIDGSPALEVITSYAKNNIRNSRDLGVRFNMALASLKFTDGIFGLNMNIIASSQFTRRLTLPDSDSITYELKCNNSETKTLKRPWRIANNAYNTLGFTDSKSYFESICLVNKTQQPITSNINQQNSELPINLSTNNTRVEIPGDQFDNFDNFTMFYKFNKTGVVVVPTFLPPAYALDQNKYQSDLIAKFKNFSQSGVEKVNFSSNGGGFIPLGEYFNEIFKQQKNFTFPRDIKINEVMSFLIDQADKQGLGFKTLSFSPSAEQSIFTGQPFKNAAEFIGDNKFTRGGVTTKFSNLFFDILNDSSLADWKSPWTNKDIIVLTDGACASTCAQTVQYLSEQAKIATVSVGGFHNTSMSYSSFPGGNVVTVDDFYRQINNITSNTTDPKPDIPKNFATDISMFIFKFTYSETHDLEFHDKINEFMYRPATHRLFYDDESIINPSILWLQAAKFIS
ncbi:4206_t:CDS:2, partial [Racocetra persica]